MQTRDTCRPWRATLDPGHTDAKALLDTKTYLPSMQNDGYLQAVGFQGTGAVDDFAKSRETHKEIETQQAPEIRSPDSLIWPCTPNHRRLPGLLTEALRINTLCKESYMRLFMPSHLPEVF